MKSLWIDSVNLEKREKLFKDIKTSVAIVGGGMAGLLTAYFLKRKGVDCIVLEAKRIGEGVTKNTTAKITSQHNLIYADLITNIGTEGAKKYLLANENAVKLYKDICKNIDCDFCELPSFVYTVKDRRKIEREVLAVNKLGFNAEFVNKIELPIEVLGAIKFNKQAQFNPFKFIDYISKNLTIYENTMVREIRNDELITDKAKIKAENIIITSHFPFINKYGFYFVKMYQHRSYVLALKNAQKLNGMYIGDSDGELSFRSYNDLLLLGGFGHRTGKISEGYGGLERISKKLYPKSEVMYHWSTQDCMSLDNIPYIGKYSSNKSNMFVATGFNKWGMTSSMIGANILSDMLIGKKNQFEEVFSPQRFVINKQVFINLFETIKNFIVPTTKRCSHLGCSLKYNKQEHSWDCACHGSRFDSKGNVINNPAMKNINLK